MRLAEIDTHFWQLESGEARHEAAPDTFEIPPKRAREGLQPGQAAKLIFEIETESEGGAINRTTERMWVVVNEVTRDGFLGVLTNKPASIAPDDDGAYLRIGCEVPFRPEHVIAIDEPPEAYVSALLSEPPSPRWPHRKET